MMSSRRRSIGTILHPSREPSSRLHGAQRDRCPHQAQVQERWRLGRSARRGNEGGDPNALKRQGIILRSVEESGERDTGVTRRRAIAGAKMVALDQRSNGIARSAGGEALGLTDHRARRIQQ
jgi:hypothetical protein